MQSDRFAAVQYRLWQQSKDAEALSHAVSLLDYVCMLCMLCTYVMYVRCVCMYVCSGMAIPKAPGELMKYSLGVILTVEQNSAILLKQCIVCHGVHDTLAMPRVLRC